jgi:acetyl esterase
MRGFPAAVDDCFAAVQWAVEYTSELGGDPRRVLVGGDSASVNLVGSQIARVNQSGN